MEGLESKSEVLVRADGKPRTKRKKNVQEDATSVIGPPPLRNTTGGDPPPVQEPIAIRDSVFPPDWIVPDGFYVEPDAIRTDEDVFVASPAFFVVASTSDEHNRNYGRMLTWRNSNGDWQEWVMDMPLLDGGMKELRAELLRAGLNIGYSGQEKKALREYILSSKPIRHITSTTRTGWREDSFVLPGLVIGSDAGNIRFAGMDSHFGLAKRGDIKSWKQIVGSMSAKNSRLVFAISAAFGSPCLKILNAESGGFHFRGRTSVGKTTALLAGASVIGGPESLRSWRTTANGLETIAEAHNDLPLMLDEIGQCEPRQVGEIAYLLANGQGKTRMDADANAQKRYRWQVLFLSSGEEKLSRYLERANVVVRGGQEVRLLDIEADAGQGYGILDDVKGFESSGEFIDAFQHAAKSNYGAVGLAFLERLTTDVDAARLFIQIRVQQFVSAHVPATSPGEVGRAASRFALVAAAGELASHYGLTGWLPGEATSAAAVLFGGWMASRGDHGFDLERRLELVREFVRENLSRFASGKPRSMPDGCAGLIVKDRGDELYLILPSVWREEVCKRDHPVEVIRSVKEAGFLVSDAGRVDKRHRVGSLNPYFYAIRASILETPGDKIGPGIAENAANAENTAA